MPGPVADGHVALGLPHATLVVVGGVDLGVMRLMVAAGEADGLQRRGVVGVDAFGHGRRFEEETALSVWAVHLPGAFPPEPPSEPEPS